MTGERSTIVFWLLSVSAALAVATGCQAPAEPTGPTLARVAVESPDRLEGLWQATDATLRRYYFEPDRQDRSQGVIVSRPETTAAWFELWRPQPAPAYLWWEANISAIRRQATVTIQPTTQTECQVSVQIDRYRFALESRQVDNPAGAMRLYSDAAPTGGGRMEKPSETGQWIPLGRDATMEQAILTAILKRYASTPSGAGTPATGTQPEASAVRATPTVAAPTSTTRPAESAG
jgi:hypothetical protein